jgi:hypothetical protein
MNGVSEMMIRSVQEQNQLEPISEYVWLCVIKQNFLKKTVSLR